MKIKENNLITFLGNKGTVGHISNHPEVKLWQEQSILVKGFNVNYERDFTSVWAQWLMLATYYAAYGTHVGSANVKEVNAEKCILI